MSAFDKVLAARAKGRLTGGQYIDRIFTGFVELHGDRKFADDPAIVGGIARLRGMPVTVIAMEKGIETKEKVRRNFGAPNPEGYRKALRLMRQAEKFGRPVVCIVDTAGAFCGIGAEERGQGQAIADNLISMMSLKTPVVSIFVGEGGSGGALAMAVADEVWMLENAIYSVISPEGCASILWKDTGRVKEAAECLKLTAQDMKRMGVVEEVVSEQRENCESVCAYLEERLWDALTEYGAMDRETLLRRRYERFRKFGPDMEFGPQPD